MGLLLLAFAAAPSMDRQMLDEQNEMRQILEAQNEVRARVGVRPLVWSDKLARAAEQWARFLIVDGGFRHTPHSPYGQNLYAITGGEFLPQQVVNGWAAEARDYDRSTNSCKPERMCGHYIQLVWRHTREVGCGVARGGDREVWACEYYPPGKE